MILAGGLRTGREALRHVSRPGRNAVIAYEYPLDPARLRQGFLPARIVAARRAALAVPGQLAAVLRWTRTQPWADPERVSLVGVSLGALVLPAAARVAAAHGEAPGPTILAYGGTDLGGILRAALAGDHPWLGAVVGWLGGLGLRALEPAAHLPHLAGPVPADQRHRLTPASRRPRRPACSA